MTSDGASSPNLLLIAERDQRGWSQRDLAREMERHAGIKGRKLDVNDAFISMLSRWENGHRRPNAFYRQLLREIYGKTDDELGLSELTGQGLLVWTSPYSTLIETLEAWRLDMERRGFLRLTTTTVTALVVPGPAPHDPEAPQRLAEVLAEHNGVDEQAVKLIETSIVNCRRLDDCFGSQDVMTTVLSQLRLVTKLLNCSLSPALRARLAAAAGELAQLAGWLWLDRNDLATSHAYFDLAMKAAQEAGDQPLGAYVLGYMSRLATYRRDTLQAIDLIRSAQRRATGTASATTCAWLAAGEAEAHAVAGEADACLGALDRAESLLQRSHPEDDPSWIYYFDRAELATYKGACLELLGDVEGAQATWREALRALNPSLVRDRSLYLTHLATTYVQQAEIEEACQLAIESLGIAVDTNSRRSVQRVHDLRRKLKPWKGLPAVQLLDAHLRAA